MSNAADESKLNDALRASLEKQYHDRFAESGNDQECLMILHKLGCFYREIGEHALGMEHVTRCFNARSDVLGPTHAETIASMRYIGAYYTFLGAFSAASGTQLLREAYTLYRGSPDFGVTHEETLGCMVDLGENLKVTGFPKEALAILKERLDLVVSRIPAAAENKGKWFLGKSVSLKKKDQPVDQPIEGFDSAANSWYPGQGLGRPRPALNWISTASCDPSTLDARLDYADILIAVGDRIKVKKLQLCEVLHRQILDCGMSAPETLRFIDKYIAVMQKQGSHEEAMFASLECLREKTSCLGPDHMETLKSKFLLAHTYLEMAQWQKLEDLQLEQSLILQESRLGEAHPDTISSRIKLGGLYSSQSQPAKALELFEKCYEQRCHSLGENHLLTLGVANNIGNCLSELGRVADARAIFERTLHIIISSVGEESQVAIVTMINFINVLQSTDEMTAADAMTLRALDISERILGEMHPDTLILLAQQCNAHMVKQQWQEAAALGEKLHALKSKTFDEYHPQMLQSMQNLGHIYKSLGRIDEALVIGLKAVELYEEHMGSKHTKTIHAKATYAVTLCDADRVVESLPMIKDCIRDGKEALGPEHPTLLEYYSVLSHCYCHLGEFAKALPVAELVLAKNLSVHGEKHHLTVASRAKVEWIKNAIASTSVGNTAEVITIDPDTQNFLQEMQQRINQAEGYVATMQLKLAGDIYKEVIGDTRLIDLVDTPVGSAYALRDHILKAKMNYALVLYRSNKYDEVVPMLEGLLLSLEASDPTLEVSKGITMCRQMLENSYAHQQKPQLVLKSMTDNWKYKTRCFGEMSEQAVTVLQARASYHFTLHDYPSARKDFVEIMRLLVQRQGADHADTVAVAHQIAALFSSAGMEFKSDAYM